MMQTIFYIDRQAELPKGKLVLVAMRWNPAMKRMVYARGVVESHVGLLPVPLFWSLNEMRRVLKRKLTSDIRMHNKGMVAP